MSRRPVPARVPEGLTRRQLFAGLGALGLLAACSSTEEGAARTSTANDTGIKSVTHPLGVTEVPTCPTRVVAVDRRSTLPHLLLLGLTPVGALTHQGITGTDFPPLLDEATAGITAIETTDGFDVPNVEEVAALRPDLILGWSGGIADIYDQLSAVAPTVGVEVDFTDTTVALRMIGEVLGLQEAAEQEISAFADQLTAAGETMGELGSIALLQNIGDGQLRVYGPEAISIGGWITDLGGTVAPELDTLPPNPDDPTFTVISPENLSLVTAETIVVLQNDGDEAAAAAAQLESSPLWSTLPAVRASRVLRLETQSAVGSFGLQGYRSVLDNMVEQWTALT